MKFPKRIFPVVAVMAGLISLSSCNDDKDESTRRLRQIVITGEVEIAGEKEEQTTTISLTYDTNDQLIEYIESSGSDEEMKFSLSYSEDKITINRNDEYYGEYVLNSQGYAESFTRPYTSVYYHTYSDDGYLIKSTYDSQEYNYTYEHGNLISIDNGGTFKVVFTPSDEIDNLKAPSFYQPVYLHIPGNIEVKIGYLAGLYGQLSYNLAESTVTTIGIGQSWEYDITVSYTYTKDKGYVVQQTEKTPGKNGTVYEGRLSFSYD